MDCRLFNRFQSLFLRNVLLPNLTNQDKDWIARKAATCGQVTVAACSVPEGELEGLFICCPLDSPHTFPMGKKSGSLKGPWNFRTWYRLLLSIAQLRSCRICRKLTLLCKNMSQCLYRPLNMMPLSRRLEAFRGFDDKLEQAVRSQHSSLPWFCQENHFRSILFSCFYIFIEDHQRLQAGGVHVIQAFVSDDISEEIQIQGRTARQGKSGTYSLILAESEIVKLGLDAARVQNMQAEECYRRLDIARKKMQSERGKKMDEVLQKANELDDQSHAYFDALTDGKCKSARERLHSLYKQLGMGSARLSGQYHVVCCYDESGSMSGRPWADLQQAHQTCMGTLQMTGVKVSIVQFSSNARIVLKLADAKVAAQTHLEFQSGGTCFKPPLGLALQLFRSGLQQHSGLTPVLLFMSDGGNDDGSCFETIRSMEEEIPGLVLHAVIFNQSDSPRLREMVEAATDGHFHVSADGVSLKNTFSSIASSLEYTGQ